MGTSGFRSDRSLTQGGGLELANGLPFRASDTAVHELLAQHPIEDTLRRQVALGKIRRASGHFRGQLLAVAPHRVLSCSQRHMRTHASNKASRPAKVAQTFWVLDADTPNLHIRYGQMTLALLAQAAIHQLRTRLGEPVCGWDANHVATDFLRGLDGDVRVQEDTMIVTYYNAPHESHLRALRESAPQAPGGKHQPPRCPGSTASRWTFASAENTTPRGACPSSQINSVHKMAVETVGSEDPEISKPRRGERRMARA